MVLTDTFLLRSGTILANEVPARDSLAFTVSSPLEMHAIIQFCIFN